MRKRERKQSHITKVMCLIGIKNSKIIEKKDKTKEAINKKARERKNSYEKRIC